MSITQEGELLELYKDKGPSGVRKYCIEKLSAFLYNSGNDSSVIKIDEYTKWRQHMDLKKPVGGSGYNFIVYETKCSAFLPANLIMVHVSRKMTS